MIRIRLTELLSERSFKEGRRVDLGEVAAETGIHRTTLSKIGNVRGYNLTASNADRLCRFFNCSVGDLMVYIPDEQVEGLIAKSFKGAKAGTDEAGAGAKARHKKLK